MKNNPIQSLKTAQEKNAMTHTEEKIVAKNIRGSSNIRNLHADKKQQTNIWVYRVNKNTVQSVGNNEAQIRTPEWSTVQLTAEPCTQITICLCYLWKRRVVVYTAVYCWICSNSCSCNPRTGDWTWGLVGALEEQSQEEQEFLRQKLKTQR